MPNITSIKIGVFLCALIEGCAAPPSPPSDRLITASDADIEQVATGLESRVRQFYSVPAWDKIKPPTTVIITSGAFGAHVIWAFGTIQQGSIPPEPGPNEYLVRWPDDWKGKREQMAIEAMRNSLHEALRTPAAEREAFNCAPAVERRMAQPTPVAKERPKPETWTMTAVRQAPTRVELSLAKRALDHFVISRLLTPAVANVPAPTILVGTKGDESRGYRIVYVVGQFDSQNAFGAMIRGRYLIQLWHAGLSPMPDDGSAVLKYFDLNGEPQEFGDGLRLDIMMNDVKDLAAQDIADK